MTVGNDKEKSLPSIRSILRWMNLLRTGEILYRRNVDPIEGPPETPRYHSAVMFEGF